MGLPQPKRGFGDPQTKNGIPKPKRGSPNQKGDPQFECRSNLGTKARFPELEQSPNQFWLVTEPIPIPKRGSRNWFGDCMIPKSVWGSHTRFGDSFRVHPQTEYGIPELVWGLHDPQIGLGIFPRRNSRGLTNRSYLPRKKNTPWRIRATGPVAWLSKYSRPLASTSSRWARRGRGVRVELNNINRLR